MGYFKQYYKGVSIEESFKKGYLTVSKGTWEYELVEAMTKAGIVKDISNFDKKKQNRQVKGRIKVI